nr:flagellar hook-basal body complex protein FliE [Buchnera aphidicola]
MINIKKIKFNNLSKKINKNNYQSYKNECIELNQEGLWIKTFIQIRKKLISSYQEIINMQV